MGCLLRCELRDAAEQFLGVPLDPYGRLRVYGIHPLEDSWASGEATVWCGITAADVLTDDGPDLYVGDVRDIDQEYRWQAGACVAYSETEGEHVAPCAEPHLREVVGSIDLSGRSEPPADDDPALWEECHSQAVAYLGAEPVARGNTAWSRWRLRAGRRVHASSTASLASGTMPAT